ncbi:MAG: flagellar biosynthesis anti-sigma factor FlgM [Lachnospiraceae bacterium]
MNINRYLNSTESANYRSAISAADKSKPAANLSAGNFDQATFYQSSKPVDEPSFARALAHAVANRLEQTDPQEKVARLQQQVADKTYQPDARRIAERILSYR